MERLGKSFRRAIELDPNRSMSYADFVSYLLLVLGRIEEALHELRIAEKADPLSGLVHARLANVLISAGRYDEAAGQCLKLSENGLGRSECLGRARLGQGRISDAVQLLTSAVDRGVPAGHPIRGYLGYAFGRAVARRLKDLQPLFRRTRSNKPSLSPVWATRTALWELWNAWPHSAPCG
jgi:tetratricopeptide (TPR) repeat protein